MRPRSGAPRGARAARDAGGPRRACRPAPVGGAWQSTNTGTARRAAWPGTGQPAGRDAGVRRRPRLRHPRYGLRRLGTGLSQPGFPAPRGTPETAGAPRRQRLRGYHRSDGRVEHEICYRMCERSQLDARDIDVWVGNGVVTLTGKVANRREKRPAEDVADSVPGVKDVDNGLSLRRPTDDCPPAADRSVPSRGERDRPRSPAVHRVSMPVPAPVFSLMDRR
ncbi:MAG TPA: BON domain-containing protein [Thermomicrobiaceae bacterium]|nr:BON domain-containing protein [Thermomicrobiaceae bacterium]